MGEAVRSLPRLHSGDAAVEVASEELVRALRASLSIRETARLAIPGGSALAAAVGARTALGRDWGRIAISWVDERCVPCADPDSNRGGAARLGLLEELGEERPAPSSILPLFEDGETPAGAVARVEARLRSDFANGLDVVLLGMGEDGHVASLFPGRFTRIEGRVAHVADSPKPPADRITLTRALLATAQSVVLLAVGESKRSALERLVEGDPALPAQGLGGLVIVTDLALGRALRSHAEQASQQEENA
jgi:6-phosphogluconolactonase